MLKEFAARHKGASKWRAPMVFIGSHRAASLWASVGAATVFAFAFGCPFRLITGIPCPGCGMTHAFLAAFRFDFADAFRWHPLFPLVMLMMAVYAVCMLVSFLRRKRRGDIARLAPADIAVMTRGIVETIPARAVIALYAVLFIGVYLIRMWYHYQPILFNLP